MPQILKSTENHYEVTELLALLDSRSSHSGTAETLEVNRISWYSEPPKIDIRWWYDDSRKPGSGVPLSDENARDLLSLLLAQQRAGRI